VIASQVVFDLRAQVVHLERQAVADIAREIFLSGEKLHPIHQAEGQRVRFPSNGIAVHRMLGDPIVYQSETTRPIETRLVKVVEIVEIVLPQTGGTGCRPIDGSPQVSLSVQETESSLAKRAHRPRREIMERQAKGFGSAHRCCPQTRRVKPMLDLMSNLIPPKVPYRMQSFQ
jgi:hypothetical protein